jgi:hypothetical protein
VKTITFSTTFGTFLPRADDDHFGEILIRALGGSMINDLIDPRTLLHSSLQSVQSKNPLTHEPQTCINR